MYNSKYKITYGIDMDTYWHIQGNIFTSKDVDAIKVESVWNMWDPMFMYYQIVFDNAEDALSFKLKNYETITQSDEITKEEWDSFLAKKAEKNIPESTPVRKMREYYERVRKKFTI